MKRITIHTHLSDPYWQLLDQGRQMSIEERFRNYWRMRREQKSIHGESEIEQQLKQKRILIRKPEWI